MVGGTTSAVQAMMLSTLKAAIRSSSPRNVHQSVINARFCARGAGIRKPETDKRLGIALGMS
jgi:arginine/lysine/ornithine decarboxylase